MHLFYYEQSSLLNLFNSGSHYISLSGDEAAHLKVLRMKPGDKLLVTDGLGNLASAVVEESGAKSNTLRITEVKTTVHPNHYIHIAVAPTKNIARFEWFLEKATEMGIDEITPFFSEHSERVNLRTDRLNKVIISAMKQSLKTFIPKLNEPTSLKAFLNDHPAGNNNFIAWLDKEGMQQHLKAACLSNLPATVLVGPEGDFSQAEVKMAMAKGFKPVSLGSSRLRTETAALAACFTINLINEPDATQ